MICILTHAVSEVSIPAELSVAEDEGTVQVCAALITPFMTEFAIIFNLATHNDTGMHYFIYNNVLEQ